MTKTGRNSSTKRSFTQSTMSNAVVQFIHQEQHALFIDFSEILFRTRSPKPVIKNAAMIKVSKTFRIGNDLKVNRLGFGAMRLTGAGIWGEPKDPEEARRVLKRAVELGVNFIDTADSYGPDVSERLIGETLSPFPKGLVVATKGGLTRQGPDRWSPDGRPDE